MRCRINTMNKRIGSNDTSIEVVTHLTAGRWPSSWPTTTLNSRWSINLGICLVLVLCKLPWRNTLSLSPRRHKSSGISLNEWKKLRLINVLVGRQCNELRNRLPLLCSDLRRSRTASLASRRMPSAKETIPVPPRED